MKIYSPYVKVREDECTINDVLPLDAAYDEAVRLKKEYGATEAGVKVFEQNVMRIISWKEGRYCYLKGTYLYKIQV